MSGVPDMIRSICPRHAILSPGISKKDKLANRIYKNTGISTDEILAVYKMGEAPPKLKANIPATPSGEPSIGSGNLSTSKKDRF